MPLVPPTTPTLPKFPLWPARLRMGRKSFKSLNSINLSLSSIPSGNSRFAETTARFPLCTHPSAKTCPNLGQRKVTVSSAVTACFIIRPLSACTPDGISMLTTLAPCPFKLSISLIPSSCAPLTFLFSPIPNMASTITSLKQGLSVNKAFALWKKNRASSLSSSSSPIKSTFVSQPSLESSWAHTKPSPPLLPLPQTHSALLGLYREIMYCAAWVPALRIISIDGFFRVSKL